MKISEVAEATGLNVSNIRFYERKGLIAPDRREDSRYREYNEEDVNRIKYIMFYRKMDLSIDEINKILEGENPKSVVKEHLQELKSKQEILNNSMDLCQMYLDDENQASVEDVEYYLGYVKKEEYKGKIYSKVDDICEDMSVFIERSFLPEGSIADSYVKAYLPDKWRRGIATFIWQMTIIAYPLFTVIEYYGEECFVDKMIGCIVWIVLFLLGFMCHKKIGDR